MPQHGPTIGPWFQADPVGEYLTWELFLLTEFKMKASMKWGQ